MGSLDIIKNAGIKVQSDIELRKELGCEEGEETIKKPLIHVKGSTKEMAVHKGLIPPAYMDVEFDAEHVKSNIIQQNKHASRKFKVRNFDKYIDTLNNIMNNIRAKTNLGCSYLIGSPNGFGKNSFVNSCIKLMLEQEWEAVPYISLSELAELRVENERTMLNRVTLNKSKEIEEEPYYYFKDNTECNKVPKIITGRYSWSEYMNADILFCFFTTVDSKVIESHTLKGILDVRGAKGLPTVVFISTSLNPYKLDYNLREYVWDEILSYKEDRNCFDRVYHVSCYKTFNSIIGDNDLGI